MGKTLGAMLHSRTVLLKMYAVWTCAYFFLFPIGSYIYGTGGVIEAIPSALGRGVYYLYLAATVIVYIFFILRNKCAVGPKQATSQQIVRQYIKRSNKIVSGLSILLFLGISLTYYFLMTESIDYSLLFNRSNRTEGVFVTQQWVIYVYFIQSLAFVSIYYLEELSNSELFLFAVLTASFCVFEIFILGARRYSVAIVLFYIYRKGYFEYLFGTKFGALLIFGAVLSGIGFGVVREFLFHDILLGESDSDYAIFLAITSNEFTEIGTGIARAVNFSMDLDNLKLGSTFINIFYFFIPRFIFEDKPLSLTYQLDIPVSIYSEFFVNFHLAGLFFIIVFAYLIGRLSRKSPSGYLSCVLAAYSFDFIRAEIATITYTLFFVAVFSTIAKRSLMHRCVLSLLRPSNAKT
jgi:hypothetical protein